MNRSDITKRIYFLEGEIKLLKRAVLKSLAPTKKKVRIQRKTSIEMMAKRDLENIINRNKKKSK